MSAKRVAILDDCQGVALSSADWSVLADRVDVEVFSDHLDIEDALAERLAEFPIVVAMRERTPFTASLLARLPALELLVTTVGADLYGRTLGLCGLGRIGGMVATVGKAFGRNLVAWSQNLNAQRYEELGATVVSKEELFRQSDVLSIHLVLSERTRGLVGAAKLALMKPDAILVNTSRGPICDEDAAARACAAGSVGAAGLDAFGVEPLPADHPFRSLARVIPTPHIGCVSQDVYGTFFRHIVQDIAGFLDGTPVRVVTS